mmetsp:Transcript_13849/g.20965  ORF Transcript_13849/g.20965 Transcript_13849/m.20965 type:complete len:160 (+) Transcript_13849:28-507(+)
MNKKQYEKLSKAVNKLPECEVITYNEGNILASETNIALTKEFMHEIVKMIEEDVSGGNDDDNKMKDDDNVGDNKIIDTKKGQVNNNSGNANVGEAILKVPTSSENQGQNHGQSVRGDLNKSGPFPTSDETYYNNQTINETAIKNNGSGYNSSAATNSLN